MDKYTDSYNKLNTGYLKIVSCIQSCVTPEQLESCKPLVDNWIALGDTYCDLVWHDHTIRHRKDKAHNLANVAKGMFDEIKMAFDDRAALFQPDQYEGRFTPKRVMSLQEMCASDGEETNEEIETSEKENDTNE